MIKKFITLFIVFLPLLVNAENKKLPIPRFASIKSNEVNARSGPAIKCPIEWVFVIKGEPVEIIAEYEQWRQIKDVKGEGGWVHSSVLSGKRFVIIKEKDDVLLFKKPIDNEKIIAQLKSQVRCQLIKCAGKWCRLNCKGTSGWVLKKTLWGVYPTEVF